MADATSPDDIYIHEGLDAVSLPVVSAAMAATIQAAFDKRERYTYVWPTSAERTAETGMTQGSLGYQVDTRSEYLYDNGNWRRATAYAEWIHASQSIANGVTTLITTPTIDSTNSSDTTFTSAGAGYVQMRDPGIYIMSWVERSSVSSTNPYIHVSELADGSDYIALAGQVGVISQTSTPFYAPSANFRLYFRIRQSTGAAANFEGVIRIIRIA